MIFTAVCVWFPNNSVKRKSRNWLCIINNSNKLLLLVSEGGRQTFYAHHSLTIFWFFIIRWTRRKPAFHSTLRCPWARLPPVFSYSTRTPRRCPPATLSWYSTFWSRATLRANFFPQKLHRVLGRCAALQPSCWCQKQPLMKMTAWCLRNTRSGEPGRFFVMQTETETFLV